jgi:hypothetical protein
MLVFVLSVIRRTPMNASKKTNVGIVTSVRETSFLPLRDAVLCNDCNFVSSDEQGVCPVCNGRSLDRLTDRLGVPRHTKESSALATGLRGCLNLLGFRRKQRCGELAFFDR